MPRAHKTRSGSSSGVREKKPRRARGEGGLFVRDRGTPREMWVGRVQLADGTRRDVYARTQAEARRKMAKLRETLAQGLKPTSDRLTLGKYLEDWLEHTARSSVRPGTFRGYSTIVHQYLIPKLGRMPLTKLTPQDIQRFQNELLRTPRKDRQGTIATGTVTNARRVLGRALEQAAGWGMIARNPVRLVDGPHVSRQETTPLDPDQAKALLESVRGDRLEALYTVALSLGLRRGEALGLMWDDVDWIGGRLQVRRSLQRVGRELRLMEVKTKKSRRTLSVPLVTVRALQVHRRRQQAERETAGPNWTGTGLVFTDPLGRPIDPQVATRSYTRALQRAGLPHQRFHDLRHACASLLLAQGLDLKVIQEILGHSTITITANLYAHVLMGLKQQAAAQMDALLGGDAPVSESELRSGG